MFARQVRAALFVCYLGLVTTLSGALTGCSSGAGPATDGPRVVAGLYPLAYVAEEIGGPDAEVTSLAAPGQEPHDLELTIAQSKRLADADLVLLVGGFQPVVDDALTNVSGQILDAADVVELRQATVVETPDHNDHDEAHSGVDPHFWLDPELLAAYAEAVTTQLVALDPAHADDYRSRMTQLRTNLTSVDADYQQTLAGCDRQTVVVSHNAFGYLTKYGLEFAAIAGLDPDAEPDPTDLAAMSELIAREGLTTVFTETLASPELAQTLARDAGVETAVLDPIEGLDPDAGGDYLSLMEQNLAALKTANSC